MEAQGCGVQVIMSAQTAINLGCTIRGIVAFTSTSTYATVSQNMTKS